MKSFGAMQMYYPVFIVHCILTFLTRSAVYASQILRPRGVALTKISLYNPETDFTCFDGSHTIPFIYVNDDYCDCLDGSDEPGTAACPNGTFHCTNAGHKPLNIPSSWVNDGICDCCDASDEYDSTAECVNNCKELGKAARIEAQVKAKLHQEGYGLRLELSKEGKQSRLEKQNKLEQLEKEKIIKDEIRAEKEKLKIALEEPEKVALEKYRVVEEEAKKQKEEEEKRQREKEALDAFELLDSNKNGKLEIPELQTRQTFDQNKDGVVSEEEAKFFLHMQDEMTQEDFLVSGWMVMKPYFMLDKGLFTPPTPTPTYTSEPGIIPEPDVLPPTPPSVEVDPNRRKEAAEDIEDYEDEDTTDMQNEESDSDDEEEEEEEKDLLPPPLPAEPEQRYDEETQKLVDAANEARQAFEEADRQSRDLQQNIRKLMDSLNKDFGEDEAFLPLDGECFEYTDREYIYKLCMFEEATQKQKHQGHETKLGSWGSWLGPPENIYAKMRYDRGQQCWNGPQRSAEVRLHCGIENKIISVTEPNKCEYLYEFSTPAVCLKLETSADDTSHDEL